MTDEIEIELTETEENIVVGCIGGMFAIIVILTAIWV